MAVRLSLGAGRGRIVRQLLTESALLAAAGGAAGVALAYWGSDLLLAMMSRGRTPIALDVVPNVRVFLFAAAVTIVTVLLFGLLPALGSGRTDPAIRLKPSALGADRARNLRGRMMVAAQVAMLVLLVTSAALFTRSLRKLHAVDAGFRQDQVFVVNVSTGPAYRDARKRAVYEDLSSRFGMLPGVQSVSLTMDAPPAGELSMCGEVAVPGRPADSEDARAVCHNFVGPRFFETLGIPLRAGRDFDAGDDDRAEPRVIISEGVARRYFRDEDPLGRQIVVGGAGPRTRVSASVVGVAKDVRYASLRAEAPLMIYRPSRQEMGAPADTFLIRTTPEAADALPPLLRAEVRAAAPALPPPSVVAMDDRVAATIVEERLLSALSTGIGALAAVLVAIGIYATVASAVARRRREIGIRMALGALPGQVGRLVVTEAVGIIAAGLAIGVPAAVAAAIAARAILAGVLFELSPVDPAILVGSAVGVLLIASLAAFVPARRAARIDPLAAIKYE